MRNKEMTDGGNDFFRYEESDTSSQADPGDGELWSDSADETDQAPLTQWEAIEEAFRRMRRF